METTRMLAKFLFLILVTLFSSAAASAEPHVAAVEQHGSHNVHFTAPETIVRLQEGPFLFIDDYLISQSDHLVRTTHAPVKREEPVITTDDQNAQPYCTVLYDENLRKYRMWYNVHSSRRVNLATIESDDGIHWNQPHREVFEFGGYGASVIDEGPQSADPQRRYKFAYWDDQQNGSDGLCIAFSPDGYRWQAYEGNPVLNGQPRARAIGDIVEVTFDPLESEYLALVKTPGLPSDGWSRAPKAGDYFRRVVSVTTSRDFTRWSPPARVMIPEPDEQGAVEFYSAAAIVRRGNLLISFVRVLRDDLSADPNGPTDGIGYTVLAVSHDGLHWERFREPFLNRDPRKEQFDHAMAWISSAVRVGDEIYFYYGGYDKGHKVGKRQIGLARLPVDRYVSRETNGEQSGRLLTPLLHLPVDADSQLTINADARNGEIRVQIVDDQGKTVDGFGFADCRTVTSDGLSIPLSWQNQSGHHAEMEMLNDRSVRIEFELKNAKLFGFDVE